MPITSSAKKALRGSKQKQVYNTRRKKAIEDESSSLEEKIQDPGNYKRKTGGGKSPDTGGQHTDDDVQNEMRKRGLL